MKSAKEWAAEVVTDAYLDDDAWIVKVHDELEYVLLEPQRREEWAQVNAADARGIIERLVERVQADARAPLEKRVLELEEEQERVRAAAAQLASLRSEMERQLRDGVDDPVRVFEKAVCVIGEVLRGATDQ